VSAILVAFPTEWDEKNLFQEGGPPSFLNGRNVVALHPRDADVRHDFDAVRFVSDAARVWRGRARGVVTSSEYPGAVAAAALAGALSLPGADAAARILCSHKHASRLAQRAAAPEATPEFALVDPLRPEAADIAFPCFVKPVRGAFSMFARRIESREELARFMASDPVREYLEYYVSIFDRLALRYGTLDRHGRYFIAESLLSGDQVTVEGFTFRGETSILGVVDSVMHPGTRSFARFDYPSALDAKVRERMGDVAARVVRQLGLDGSLFNVEMFHDPASGRISVIEVNPRMCGQFADLYEKVDGTNAYEIALALAAGERPGAPGRRAGAHAFAASVPLRVFEPVRVLAAPDEAAVRAAEAFFPGTLVWSEARVGETLGELESSEDGASRRYAVINVGAPDRAGAIARAAAIEGALGFHFGAMNRCPTPS
jgi:biotin carboxylase